MKTHSRCRVCNTPLPAPYLDLGEQPLANALCPASAEPPTPNSSEFNALYREDKYPLAVTRCHKCDLSQLTVVVDPAVLYAGYRFRSGVSETWLRHCEDLAASFKRPGTVLDIAANDGTLLRAFAHRGWEVEGVDPCPLTTEFPMYAEQWSEGLAATIVHRKTFDLIIAQNVLGHVDDVLGFLRGIKMVLAPEGRAIIEVPHVGELLRNCAFDTIYHEHLSYWSLGPLQRAAWRAGLRVVDVERLTTHGGSRRYWLAHSETPMKHSVPEERLDEYRQHLHEAGPYERFAAAVEQQLEDIQGEVLWRDGAPGHRLVGWGASAKAAVMLNALAHCDTWLPKSVIDDCPEKQGLLMPGVHIPIIAPPDDLSDVDVLWVLSWNNFAAIKAKAENRGFKGKYLLTHPTPRLIDT